MSFTGRLLLSLLHLNDENGVNKAKFGRFAKDAKVAMR
jgi:hypothetical protein